MEIKNTTIEHVLVGQSFYYNDKRYMQLIVDKTTKACRAYCYDTDELEDIFIGTEVKVFNIFH